jgi:hypothetical protein
LRREIRITLLYYPRKPLTRQADLDVYVLSTLVFYSELKDMERSKSGHGTEVVSFIVRCWPHLSTRGTVWHGEVEHVQSGRRAAFRELSQIAEVLQELMDSISESEKGLS